MLIKTLATGDLNKALDPSSKFYKLVQTCTKLNASERYQSAAKVKEILKSIQSPSSTNANSTAFTYKSILTYLPPGFRTLQPLKMFIAAIGYVFIFWLTLTFESKNQTTLAQTYYERFFLLIMCLFIVFFSCNYRNMRQYFRFCTHKNLLIRILASIVWCILSIFMLFVILLFGELLFI